MVNAEPLDAVVIGAGFAGLYMVYRLREDGLSVHGFERGDGVGGTWYWNRYPGARCDSEIMYYSFSFLSDLEQEWPLTERYPGQPDILRYLEEVASRLDLRKDFTFGAEVTAVEYDEATHLWTLRTAQGHVATARYVVTAVGCLSAANYPEFPGAEQFQGLSLHTGNWPREPVDFTGKRVAVIGTGASGIQAIPVIAEQAAELTVFQRTAQFTIPAENGPLDQDFVSLWKQNYPEWRRRARHSLAGFPYTASVTYALEVSAEERRAAFEAAWGAGGFTFLSGTFRDLVMTEEANATAADFVRSKIDEIVHDPAVAAMLKPHGFPIGTKRLPLDTNYYETFNRPNVTLVDLKQTPVTELTTTGITTSAGHHEVDVIIYATGFDAMTGALSRIDVRGRDGISLGEFWASEGPLSYLGLAVAGFPNLFTIQGPGSPSAATNFVAALEQHVEWIGDCIAHLRDRGIRTIEATATAQQEWIDHATSLVAPTVLVHPSCNSWYNGGNVPGKKRMYMGYTGGIPEYRRRCDEIAAGGYTGFKLA